MSVCVSSASTPAIYSVFYLSYLIGVFGADYFLCGTYGPTIGAQDDCEVFGYEDLAGKGALTAKLLSGNL